VGTLQGSDVTLTGDVAHRVARVLRMKRGDNIILSEGGEAEYEIELTGVTSDAIAGTLTQRLDKPAEPRVELTLYQALIRPNRFDLVLEKGTEIGVSRFVPVTSERSQIPDRAASGNRMSRWQRLIVEAAEQSGRGRPPEIVAPVALDEALRTARGLKLLPWEGERLLPLGAHLRGLNDRPAAVSLFIGPEGGFDRSEVDLARTAGCTLVTLGPRILRSETAGIVASALVLDALDSSPD
jgi:16S rRNA (uracil1498-N3)-methyltransferase